MITVLRQLTLHYQIYRMKLEPSRIGNMKKINVNGVLTGAELHPSVLHSSIDASLSWCEAWSSIKHPRVYFTPLFITIKKSQINYFYRNYGNAWNNLHTFLNNFTALLHISVGDQWTVSNRQCTIVERVSTISICIRITIPTLDGIRYI